MASLFTELNRRNVLRVGVFYGVAGWLVLQVGQLLFEVLDVPPWGIKLVLGILVLGFPIALICAWVFEVTEHGIKWESEIDRSKSITSETARRLDIMTMVLLVGVVSLFLIDRVVHPTFSDGRPPQAIEPPPAPQGPRDEGGGFESGVPPAPELAEERSVAVLPFTTRSRDEDDVFFSDGVHDDLLTQLAKIGELKVISRTSVMEYRDTTKRIPDIAAELGVATVVEGAVQRSGPTVRITAQLIEAQTDKHLWAETYDRELTATNLFAIQTEIATSIAAALHTTLSAEEEAALERQLTDDLVAMDAYRRVRADLLQAAGDALVNEQLLRTAIQRDPEFAAAWGMLAQVYLTRYWFAGQNIEDRELAWEAIQTGRAIAPDLPELDIAEGYYHYHGFLDYDAALEVLERARLAIPNNSGLILLLAYINRRAGRFDQTVEQFKRVIELDPLNSTTLYELANTQVQLRRITAAQATVPILNKVDLKYGYDHFILGMIAFLGHGDVETARVEMEQAPLFYPDQYILKGWVRALDGDLEGALALADLKDQKMSSHGTYLTEQLRGLYFLHAGETDSAQQSLSLARAELEEMIAAEPNNGNHLRALCQVLGGQGDQAAAEGVCARAIENERVDAFDQGVNRFEIALGLAHAGLVDQALDQIEFLLAAPVGPMFPRFEIEPAFGGLKENPRWLALKAKYDGGK